MKGEGIEVFVKFLAEGKPNKLVVNQQFFNVCCPA